MNATIREEFEKAYKDMKNSYAWVTYEMFFCEWAARWMAERCAKLAETSTITIPNESGGSVTMSKDGGHIAVEIRQLAKELQ